MKFDMRGLDYEYKMAVNFTFVHVSQIQALPLHEAQLVIYRILKKNTVHGRTFINQYYLTFV